MNQASPHAQAGDPNAGAVATAAAKAPSKKSAQAPAASNQVFDTITYIPDDEGDKAKTVWNGIEFKANIPVKVARTSCVTVPLPIRTPMKDEDGKQAYARDEESGDFLLDERGKKIPLFYNGVIQPDGTLQTRHVEQKVPMVDLARNNPRFSVNGAEPFKPDKGESRRPTDANQYRAWAARWVAKAMNLEELNARWAHENALREVCGVTEQDLGYVLPMLEMRREELQSAAA